MCMQYDLLPIEIAEREPGRGTGLEMCDESGLWFYATLTGSNGILSVLAGEGEPENEATLLL